MNSLYYIFYKFGSYEDGGKGDAFRGALGVILLTLPGATTLANIINRNIYNPLLFLSRCCSFGDVTNKNIFSVNVIAYTFWVLPMEVILVMYILKKCKDAPSKFMKNENLPSGKLHLLIISMMFIMLGPLGVHGKELVPFLVLFFYVTCFVVLGLWIGRYRKTQQRGQSPF